MLGRHTHFIFFSLCQQHCMLHPTCFAVKCAGVEVVLGMCGGAGVYRRRSMEVWCTGVEMGSYTDVKVLKCTSVEV